MVSLFMCLMSGPALPRTNGNGQSLAALFKSGRDRVISPRFRLGALATFARAMAVARGDAFNQQ